MVRRLLPLISLVFFTLNLDAQHVFWRDVSVDPLIGRSKEEAVIIKDFRAISVDMMAFKKWLSAAPEEQAKGAEHSALKISIPLPGGETEAFLIYRSPVMMPRLAAKYPGIQSFKLIGLERAGSSGRLAYGDNGLSAILRTSKGEIMIETLEAGQEELYRVYYSRSVEIENQAGMSLSCGFSPSDLNEKPVIDEWEAEKPAFSGRSGAAPLDLRIYSLALACTGEYAQNHGGTTESVLSSFNDAVSLLTEIYESEVSIRFMLIEETEKLIWLDPVTDPFSNADNGRGLIDQIDEAIAGIAQIALTSFDIGHLFTGNCSDVGGVAAGQACNFGREKGVTCHSSNNVPNTVRRVMAHEIGHQFSASHSFTNCPPSQGAVVAGKAVEPGSGSTIMSYAGLCGSQNIAGDNDTYFHVQSLNEIIFYSRVGTGNTCATRIATDNTEPTLSFDYISGFFIPVSTPFQLAGTATDQEDESLTYCWEEFDIGPLSVLGDPQGNTPVFRSYPPGNSPKRIFPRIEDIVTGTNNRNEVLPDYGRDLTFRMTVRDNHSGGGGVAWKSLSFQTTGEAGPFEMISPDTDRPVWETGTFQEVVWDVANTDSEPVNCQWVNILLSTDGGYNYPYVLATRVPNTGSAMVPVPDIETVAARIKVEANDNIFFNISSLNFRIAKSESPGFTFQAAQNSFDVCLPDQIVNAFETHSFLGYNENITFEVIDGLPQGATAGFEPATLKPGETTVMNIDLPDMDNAGQYPVRFRAVVPGQDTVEQNIYLDLISNDFSEVSTVAPEDGTKGIGLTTTLAWTGSANAGEYLVQLASNPSFQDPYLLDEAVLAGSATEFEPNVILEENTLHYWRVQPRNLCGQGDFLPVSTFHTENLICTSFNAEDTPVVIPGSGLPTKESVITIGVDGVISDLNIPMVKGNYQPVSSLRLTLISPAGTEVILFDGNCGNTTDLALGFDDQAPDTIVCPPDDAIVFQPVDSLAAFIGESTQGDWTLRVQVIEAGFGGVGNISEWRLEFCAKSTPKDPVLVTNDTLPVPPGLANPVTTSVLEAQDEDNTADELIYTLLRVPSAGTLYFLDQPLAVGDQFRQASIDAFNLYYLNDDANALLDSFIFVVEDGTGGWIKPHTFTIKLDDEATVDTDEPAFFLEVRLFPNPARSLFTLQLGSPLEYAAQLTLFDARGSLMQQQLLPAGEQQTRIDVSRLPSGLYFLRLQSGKAILTRRVIVQ